MTETARKRTFSWSRIRTYADCPTMYKEKYLGRKIPIKKAKPLALGSCMAKAMQAFRTGKTQSEVIAAFTDEWVKGGRILDIEKATDPRRSVERGLEIVRNYMLEFPDEPARVVQPEVAFELPMYVDEASGETIYFQGRIDGVLKMASEGLCIIEDKTTSRLGPSYFAKMKGSSQVLWYLWVSSELGLFNIDEKPTMPKCIINAIYVHEKNDRFERDITMRSTRYLEATRKNLIAWMKHILISEEHDSFPKNDVDNSICTAYGGCDYLPLKYVTGERKARILETMYVDMPYHSFYDKGLEDGVEPT